MRVTCRFCLANIFNLACSHGSQKLKKYKKKLKSRTTKKMKGITRKRWEKKITHIDCKVVVYNYVNDDFLHINAKFLLLAEYSFYFARIFN